MRISNGLIVASALLVAMPAVAQDNAAAPANSTAGNAAVPAAPPPTSAAAPTTSQPTQTADAPATSDTGAPNTAPAHHGFPWGVLGLIGLIGLFGVRKVKA